MLILMQLFSYSQHLPQITIEKSGNRLLIHGSKKIAEIEEIIKQIDVPALSQIMLEAKLIEVSLSDQEKMGIDWAKLAKLGYYVTEAGLPYEFPNGAKSGSLIPGMKLPKMLQLVLSLKQFNLKK